MTGATDPDLLDARHVIASAAGNVAQVAAQISRALAWESSADQVPACVSNCETALEALRRADRNLQEAIVRLRLCSREEAPSAGEGGMNAHD